MSLTQVFFSRANIHAKAVGDVLCLEREPTNSQDRFAIAVMDAGSRVVGHVPFNLVPTVSNFITRSVNKGTACNEIIY